ncbi:hypothetical protein AB0N16_34585 [Streptomyces sp. NPDC051105]|uniref:hypothetical protein n=1 Tax=Streptomyces sp. NPDC051105 TaxID=3154843 RepID=UPI00343B84D4
MKHAIVPAISGRTSPKASRSRLGPQGHPLTGRRPGGGRAANRHYRLRSLALLTGPTALTEDSRLLPGTAWFDVLGRTDLAVVSAQETVLQETVLVGGHHDPAVRDRRIAAAPARHSTADSDDERVALAEQLAWRSRAARTSSSSTPQPCSSRPNRSAHCVRPGPPRPSPSRSVRTHGLRRSHCRGLAKTHVQHVLTALT